MGGKNFAGRCVAGRRLGTGSNWIRLLENDQCGLISNQCSVYDNDRRLISLADIKPGNVLEVHLSKPFPERHQIENELLAKPEIRCIGNASRKFIMECIENPSNLWDIGSHQIDRVPENELDSIKRSLYLIHLGAFELFQLRDDFSGKWKSRASFEYNSQRYNLSVTDPDMRKLASNFRDKRKKLEDAILCISLGTIYKGFAYKLVAGVMLPESSNS